MTLSKIRENFELKINKNPTIGNLECWVWTGSTLKNGYGQFSCGGGKMILAHRFSYSLYRRAIPAGKLVLHSCDNKWCVNPKHLRVGTARENIADAVDRKRLRFGEIHHRSKMTDNQVDECRLEWKSKGNTSELAKRFKVNRSTIQRIVGMKSRTVKTDETVFAKKLFTK